MAKWVKQQGLGLTNLMNQVAQGLEIVVKNELEVLKQKMETLERIEKMKRELKNG